MTTATTVKASELKAQFEQSLENWRADEEARSSSHNPMHGFAGHPEPSFPEVAAAINGRVEGIFATLTAAGDAPIDKDALFDALDNDTIRDRLDYGERRF